MIHLHVFIVKVERFARKVHRQNKIFINIVPKLKLQTKLSI